MGSISSRRPRSVRDVDLLNPRARGGGGSSTTVLASEPTDMGFIHEISVSYDGQTTFGLPAEIAALLTTEDSRERAVLVIDNGSYHYGREWDLSESGGTLYLTWTATSRFTLATSYSVELRR